jgi:DNA-binding LacI/PurR family transcriptional regulator
MVDVARLAGVSQQTVSRVVNNMPNVTPEVQQRVERAIAQLNYRRNSAARSLATQKSMVLGVISYGLGRHGHSTALMGIAEAARAANYATSLITVKDIGRAELQAAIDHHVDDYVAGIILLAPIRSAIAAARDGVTGLPLVAFEPNARDSAYSVAADEALGARLATEHLLGLGHDTVVHLKGPDGWLATDARIDGWRSTLVAQRRVVLEPIATNWDAPSGAQAARQVVDSGATAVFAANDQTALGLIYELKRMGLRVPEDISVVGFDDHPESAYFAPSLTTVRVDFDAIGRAAVRKILGVIRGEPANVDAMFVPKLVVRDSASRPGNRSTEKGS